MDKELQDKVSAILFKYDPVELAVSDEEDNYNTDEYDFEAEMIVERFANVSSIGELKKMIYNIFVEMFNAWSMVRYKKSGKWKKIAQEIWLLLGNKKV